MNPILADAVDILSSSKMRRGILSKDKNPRFDGSDWSGLLPSGSGLVSTSAAAFGVTFGAKKLTIPPEVTKQLPMIT